MAQREPRELVADVERLLDEIESLADAGAREKAIEVVRALLDLYGAGLERIVEEIGARDGREILDALTESELVVHLLLLHGLHPVPLEQRVLGALDSVRPYLESHGGNVELLAIDGAAVRLRLQGSCSGCPSSTMTLKLAIENAIRQAAPEIEEVIAQDPEQAPAPLLQIEVSQPEGSWTMVGQLRELSGGRGGPVAKQIAGAAILFLELDGRFYAYRSGCPACEQSLEDAVLAGIELTCAGCGNRYDVIRAGRCVDSPQLHLEPVPLLVGDDELVKIALPIPA